MMRETLEKAAALHEQITNAKRRLEWLSNNVITRETVKGLVVYTREPSLASISSFQKDFALTGDEWKSTLDHIAGLISAELAELLREVSRL